MVYCSNSNSISSTACVVLAFALAAVCAHSACAAVPPGSPTTAPLWPVPQHISLYGAPRAVASDFKISSYNPNANLVDAMERYESIIQAAIAKGSASKRAAGSASTLVAMAVVVTGHDGALNQHTDYSYLLEVSPLHNVVTASAKTVFGAMYAMETFSQMLVDGMLNASYAVIDDEPQYIHRGLLIDSGRRFAPVPMLKQMMDAMAYSKMNVLHLHLSDWGGFRVHVPALSELTKDLDGQFYTAADAEELVTYASHRGIRIIAEVDVPSHSGAFTPLIPLGLQFCDSNNQLLKDDAKTIQLVQTAVSQVMNLFPDVVVHLGGDETVPQGGCTWDNIHNFEKQMQVFLASKGRQPMVWNEVFSKPNATTEPNAAQPGTIIQNWDGATSATTTSAGFATVVSEYKTLYLDQECCATGNSAAMPGNRIHQCYYVDIAEGVNKTSLVYGGETAMWTDVYCPNTKCPNEGQYSWMYPSTADAQFSASLLGLVWPRATGAAGAFWHYNTSAANSSTPEYAAVIAAHNDRLIARGVDSCPNNCTCDWGSRCGKPYGVVPAYPMKINITNKCKFHIEVKEVTPCVRGAGAKIATIMPNATYQVTTDFLIEGGAPIAVGDPWSLWVGSAGWRDLAVDIEVSWSKMNPGYLSYTQTYPLPP